MTKVLIDEMFIKQMAEDIRDIRQGVGALQVAMSNTNNEYGQRLAKVEVRAGIVSIIVSAVGAFLGWKFNAN